MAKFTIHYKGGMFSGYSSTSKEKMINQCKGMNQFAEICEEKILPSPWNGKPSKHGITVFKNM